MEDWRGEKGKPNSVARIVNQDPYGCFVNDGFETNDIYQVVNYSLINKIPKKHYFILGQIWRLLVFISISGISPRK